MMVPLLGAELRRIVGRRGSFYGSIAFALLIVVIAVLAATPSDEDSAIEIVSVAGRYAGLLGVVVMGALAGSYDTANGTMRYLVLTGVPRWKLAVVRLLGIMLAVLPMSVMILAIGIAWGASEGGLTGKEVAESAWSVVATLWTWGVVAASIGMLMRSNGPAIAVGIVLFFGGTLITGLVYEFISEELSNYLLPSVFEQVASLEGKGEVENGDFKIPLGGAVVGLVVWLGALTGLAIGRTNRDEY